MSKLISVKLDEGEFQKLEASARKSGISRNALINRAVRLLNRLHERRASAKELRQEAEVLGRESMTVLRRFDDAMEKVSANLAVLLDVDAKRASKE